MNKRFLISLSFLLLMPFILSCGKDNPTAPDTQPPSVSIIYPADKDTVLNTEQEVIVVVTDNEAVARVELYIDGTVVSDSPNSIVSSNYIFGIDFGNYSRGNHIIMAKAYDSAENTGVSNFITVSVLPDFVPDGNGYIRVEILHYQEILSLDLGIASWGDPYFGVELKYGDKTLTALSGLFIDRQEISNPYSHDFDIPDDTEKFDLNVWVYDDDSPYSDDDLAGSFTSTLYTNSLPIEKEYTGSYCKLKVRVSTVPSQEVAAGKR